MATPRSQTVTSVATEKSPFEAILPPQLSVCVVAISTKKTATYKKGRSTHCADVIPTVLLLSNTIVVVVEPYIPSMISVGFFEKFWRAISRYCYDASNIIKWNSQRCE